ncbi:MAG: glucokinase [Pseudomonadota bacterium]
MKILAGDIGGTKTLLQIAEITGENRVVLDERRFENRNYSDFPALLGEFLRSSTDASGIERACIAVAGPVRQVAGGQFAKITNLPWQIDASALSLATGIPWISLINDFQAVGYGIGALSDTDLAVLQTGSPRPHAPRMIVGAGTGLGVAQMIWQGYPAPGRYEVIPSEGGHTDFAPVDEQQIELLRYLQRRHEHVSYDRILSGPGLIGIYTFLHETTEAKPVALQTMLEHADPAAAISAAAQAGTEPRAIAALDLFAIIYGAQAGNLALLNLAYGGVYIAGGIAPQILTHLSTSGFMRAFLNKGRMSALLAAMPVYVVTNPKVGLMGAAVYAAQQ